MSIRATGSGRIPLCITALLILILTCVAYAGPKSGAKKMKKFKKGRVLIKARAGLPTADLDKLLRGKRSRRGKKIRGAGVEMIEVPEGTEEAVMEALRKDPCIQFAELDLLVELADVTPNDPRFSSQWHLSKVKAPAAWDDSQGSGIIIAICDTGIYAAHEDLKNKLVAGYNTVLNNTSIADVHGHGTSVAGTAAAAGNNSLGVASVAYAARIMPIKISELSNGAAYSSDIAEAIIWAADHGARVANVSYAVTGHSSVESAAKYMRNKGGLVVIAAGNSGSDTGISDSEWVISVSATTSSDTKASWSSYGANVDVSAPGAGILTTTKGGGYGSVSGTSFSSPLTAGVIALIFAANPDLTPAEAESILEDSADDLGATGWDSTFGYGRVNAASAVWAALDFTTSDTTNPVASISSPTGGTVSGTVSVNVTASDNQAVAGVELFVNGYLHATDSEAPFEFSWDTTAISDGTAKLVARATDEAGNTGDSSTVTVTVDNIEDEADTTAPKVSITSPSDGATVKKTVALRATATDDVALKSMKLYLDGTLVASGTESSISYSWNTRKATAGTHTIKAVAEDSSGNSSSTSISVKIEASVKEVRGKKAKDSGAKDKKVKKVKKAKK